MENTKLRWETIPDRGTHHGKARLCLVEVLANGTRRKPCWDERSAHELIALRSSRR